MKIKELLLYSNSFSTQFDFYSKVLGLEILLKESNQFKVKIGSSVLCYVQKEKATPYHFAFNIYSNQEKQAMQWLKDKVSILKDNHQEIIDFSAWNAKAIYFYDPDKNIVEFIARKNLNQNSDNLFNSNGILEISEIGVATSNVEKQYHFLNQNIGLSKYSGDFERFCAIGSENGLFICIDKNKKDWFPNNDKAYSSDFMAKIEVNDIIFELEYSSNAFTLMNS